MMHVDLTTMTCRANANPNRHAVRPAASTASVPASRTTSVPAPRSSNSVSGSGAASRPVKESRGDCSICLMSLSEGDFHDPEGVLPCLHHFHGACLKQQRKVHEKAVRKAKKHGWDGEANRELQCALCKTKFV